MLLEIIAININDISKINKSKATQIELCSNMSQGGYTPDYDLIKASTELSKLPVRVMVRRSNDGFNISPEEFNLLLADIEFIKTTKATGIVCGILTKHHTIDIDRMKTIVELARPLKVTFHRAFDEVKDHKIALQQLVELGIDSVLTAGGTKPILDNLGHIKKLEQHQFPIKILLGSGINLKNINIFKNQKLTNIHVGRCVREDESFNKPISIELIKQIYDIFEEN